MMPDLNRVISVWFAAVLAASVGALAYREYLKADADGITIVLCEHQPVITGAFSRCLKHYAPAAAELPSMSSSS
jgi:hypothetical protein